MASLPEKWYCEMNKWDPDRAYCGGPEETDSEVVSALLTCFNLDPDSNPNPNPKSSDLF